MITKLKSRKPLVLWVFWKKLNLFGVLLFFEKVAHSFGRGFFAMSKCAAVPEMTNVETQPIDGKMCPSLWSPLPLVWPLRYLRGHPCTRVGIGRGPEGGEHLVTFPPPPSPIPKIPNLSFFLSFGVVVAPALFLWCSRIYIIRLEAFGKVLEERFEYLIVHTLSFFPLTEALGLSQETQSPDRQNFSPSALYLD